MCRVAERAISPSTNIINVPKCQQRRRSLETRFVERVPCTIDKGQSVRYVCYVSSVKTLPGVRAHLDHFGTPLYFSLIFLYIPGRPDQLWSPPILLLNGCRGLLLGVRAVGAWNRHHKFLCGISRCDEDKHVDNNRQVQLLLYIEGFNPVIAYCIIGGLIHLQIAVHWMV